MEIYSHNRLSYYEQCPLKYKLRYIDKLPPQVGQSIEAFLGIRVHETLEKLYDNELNGIPNKFDEIKNYFIQTWEENWNGDIQIINKRYKPIDYKQNGIDYITNYFLKNLPFNQDKTIALEKELIFKIDDENIKIKGIIDRLAKHHDRYIIHDYKTGKKLPSKKSLSDDRQLGIYALALKQNYENVEKIELIWHFLAHEREIKIKPKSNDLKNLEKNLILKIKKVENTKKFPSKKSFLCNWCEYYSMCF